MKRDQLHLRSDTADIVRDIAQKTGMTNADVNDELIRIAIQFIDYEPVEVVTRYKIVVKERRQTK